MTVRFKLKSDNGKKFLAEFLGTFLMMAIGLGGIAQSMILKTENSIQVNLAFGFGVMIAFIVTGRISGTKSLYFILNTTK
jgi:glycerol uptake facilitator-like aquaporin